MGKALSHTVFRGHVSAKELFPALWVDRFDQEDNPNGYQRPHEVRRSRLAAEYATTKPKAFWSEAILNVRIKGADNDPNIGDPLLGISRSDFGFTIVDREHANFGLLSVAYEASTKQLGDETVPWNRAFSVVDSQHRLLGLEGKDVMVPVCIFKGLGRKEEAIIFKDVNDNQKPMPTKLVDTILLKTEGHFHEPDTYIATRLHSDPTSPFHNYLDLGGRRPTGAIFFASIEGIRQSVTYSLREYLEPIRERRRDTEDREKALEKAYQFVLTYWRAVSKVWPLAFDTSLLKTGKARGRERYVYQKYKLLTSAGITGLARLGYDVLSKKCVPSDDFSEDFILGIVQLARAFDWEKDSRDMAGVAGPGGGMKIYRALRDMVLPPTI